MTKREKYVASAREEDVYRVDRSGQLDADGKRVKAHLGKQTIRTAVCSEHMQGTNVFVGVNANGWIFRCPGGRGGHHYFTSTPPQSAGEART